MQPRGSIPHSQGFSNNLYPEPNHSSSSHWLIYLQYILILSFHVRLGLPVGLHVKISKALLLYSIVTTCPAHLNLLDLVTLTLLCERHKSWSLSLFSTSLSCLLGIKNRLKFLISNILNLRSCLNDARDQGTHTHARTRGKGKYRSTDNTKIRIKMDNS